MPSHVNNRAEWLAMWHSVHIATGNCHYILLYTLVVVDTFVADIPLHNRYNWTILNIWNHWSFFNKYGVNLKVILSQSKQLYCHWTNHSCAMSTPCYIPNNLVSGVNLDCSNTIQAGSCGQSHHTLDDIAGGRLNKKDGLTRYGDSHVKDKTS